MDTQELDEHLSRMKTQWSLVFQAQGADTGSSQASRAQQKLLLRYYGAVYRYLRGMVRDAAVAEELSQDFVVRFLRGDFRQANPQRGRFRDFLKVALRHLVIDHWRQAAQHKKVAQPLPDEALPLAAQTEAESDATFLAGWREELLARTWEALAQYQQESGSPYHAVLRGKTEQPQIRSAQLAKTLSAQLDRPFTETSVRQILHRARDKFADLLLEEVARSLPPSEPAELEQELIDLGLLDYCASALKRRGPTP